MQTKKSQYTLDEKDCARLLKEYRELRASYEAFVVSDASLLIAGGSKKYTVKEFWEMFLKKNLEYETEIFGGNNPIFVPELTNEKDYQDRYKVNQRQLLQTAPSPVLGKKASLDVDFVRNTEINELPAGYGSYKSQGELAHYRDNLESGDQINEERYQIHAKKVISKYNQNSSRIIESN